MVYRDTHTHTHIHSFNHKFSSVSDDPPAQRGNVVYTQLWRLSPCLGGEVSMSGYFLNESKGPPRPLFIKIERR